MNELKIGEKEEIYYKIMRIIQEDPRLTQREMAQKIGVSLGGLHYCLKALINKGLVKIQNFNNAENKYKYLYILTPKGIKEKSLLTYFFFDKKIQEYEYLKGELENLKEEIKNLQLKKT